MFASYPVTYKLICNTYQDADVVQYDALLGLPVLSYMLLGMHCIQVSKSVQQHQDSIMRCIVAAVMISKILIQRVYVSYRTPSSKRTDLLNMQYAIQSPSAY